MYLHQRFPIRAILVLLIAAIVPVGAEGRARSLDRSAGASRQATTLVVRPPVGQAQGPRGAPVIVPAVSLYRRFEGELQPLEMVLFDDAADGRLDHYTLLAAALVAGGVEDAQCLARHQTQLDELTDQLRRSGKVTGTPRQKARAIFEFMHRRILREGYQLSSSDLAVALDQGRFNCVSASVLFNCLAERFGLVTCGLEIPGHAMSRVILPNGVLDIETTCPRWFDLMDNPRKQAELVAETTGFRHSRGSSSAECREVSGAGLVATIYYNRGVDLLAQSKFAEAVAANAKALRLDPTSTTAHGNLLATLNNWAISLGRTGHYEDAIARLRDGLSLDSSYETFHVNYVHVHHQWADRVCREGRFQEAVELLARAADELPRAKRCHDQQFQVYRRWATALLSAGRTDEAFSMLAEARRRGGDCRRLAEAEIAAVNDCALVLTENHQFEKAVALLDRGLADQPDSALLEGNRRAAVMRWAEPAFHDGDYAEAIRRTTFGAKPGRLHEALQGNVRYGYHRWISRLVADGRLDQAESIRRQALADPHLEGHAAERIPTLRPR